MKSIIGILVVSFLNFKSPHEGVGTIVVNVNNIQVMKGNIKAILYNRANFLTPVYLDYREIRIASDNNPVQLTFNDIPVGEYSVAIYHDVNDNNLFDRNWIGYPKEPFAISNNLRPFKILFPSFDAAKVVLSEKGATLSIALIQ